MTETRFPTDVEILEAAADAFKKEGSFTSASFFGSAEGPGDAVGQTCAIGGVEQAIWRLTNERVPKAARFHARYDDPAELVSEARDERDAVLSLYYRVMARLNAAARRTKIGKEAQVINVEDLTFTDYEDEDMRKIVRALFLRCAKQAARDSG